MLKYFKFILFYVLICFQFNPVFANNPEFNIWLNNFKKIALDKGISIKTVNEILSEAKFIDRVIVYDNRQPEFFEKTNIYISKRARDSSKQKAKLLLKKYNKIFTTVEKDFAVNKEIILALWSIETNYGNNFGKMDIISSLATLSFDKRRSAFFTKELLILLSLIDKKTVSKEMLYGSWAGAVGNFQFMPSTILNYGIDYDNDNKIDLKKSKWDSIASAANYINKIGWDKNLYCFQEVKFTKDVDKVFFNHSARKLKEKHDSIFWNNLGIISKSSEKKINLIGKSALVLPDGDINSPQYLVSDNYERILKWNRSLRFALSVCTLANKIKNEY